MPLRIRNRNADGNQITLQGKYLIAAAVLIGILSGGSLLMFHKASKELNAVRTIHAPTMGGKQVWSDFYIRDGWRIQENALTGHFRLLDPNDVRHYWGTYEECLTALHNNQRQLTAVSEQHLVILVHGILRSGGSFAQLEQSLTDQGYETLSLSYASTRRSLEQHGSSLAHILRNLDEVDQVSFVTHSMGALVLRHALSELDGVQDMPQFNRAVLIAPPNNGSQMADMMLGAGPFQSIYGVAGQQLKTDDAKNHPALKGLEFAVIAGGRGDPDGFNPLLEGDDDGVVTVAETKLAGMVDFKILPALHSTILSKSETAIAVHHFLKLGRFDPESSFQNKSSNMEGDPS